ncbi:MAG: PDZ domain-containing protein [Chloroflexi bacterium]|nr:PDZ domain-containing protein [Chloroflexota bacterium]
MRKKLLGGLLVVAILATAGTVATQVNTTEASTTSHTNAERASAQGGMGAEQSESTSRPFIGIAITSVPEGSDTDGALIVRVVEGSAADGNLQVDDIITALDDESVAGPRDVVSIVRDHAPGDVIVFSVFRDGTGMNISITVGERDESAHDGRSGNRGGYYKSGIFGKSNEHLVLSDTRYMTDDGVKTVRKAVGTAQNIDTDAGTFDLLLRDDSETLSFTIDDDTRIATDAVEGEAGLSDLSADATTMVVQVTNPDGTSQVQSVVQGDYSLTVHSILGRHGFNMVPRLERDGSGGFSPQRFFFRWRGGNDQQQQGNYDGNRGRGGRN